MKEGNVGVSKISAFPQNVVQHDPRQASESPTLDDVREILGSTTSEKNVVVPDRHSRYDESTAAAEKNAARDANTAQRTDDEVDVDAHTLADDADKYFKHDATHEIEAAISFGTAQQTISGMPLDDDSFDNSSPIRHQDAIGYSDTPPAAATSEHVPADLRGLTQHTITTPEPSVENAIASCSAPAISLIVSEGITPTASKNLLETPTPLLKPSTSPSQSATRKLSRTPRLPQSSESFRAESPGQSPQIVTSLLRRESLRRKETPEKKRTSRRTRSPKKRDTLSRRDTLQEREILQKVMAETDPEQSLEDFDNTVTTTLAADANVLRENAQKCDLEHSYDVKAKDPPADSTECVVSMLDEVEAENKDLHSALEDIEAYGSPKKNEASEPSMTLSVTDIQATKALDGANESDVNMEIEDATQASETDKNQIDSSNRRTRSGARFSDDTSMLKEFLNRAQAKKAAKTPILSVIDVPKPQISPRRSPRKALGAHGGNALSPQKLRDVPNRPGTPPGKPKLDAPGSDEVDEISAEITSCRRSTRTRLPAPAKGVPGAPSFIPVRRADGTDPVVLQKSQAQELAMITRANTRRNKGQSKPPLLALQDLPTETTELVNTTKQRAPKAKYVGWAETLASYQDAKEAEEAEETRPKVRRMRGLGAANGTPAPKKTTAVMSTSNGTPAPKRRGKVR